jgi:hypothetical protein
MLVPTRWKIAFEIVAERCYGCGGPSKAPCVRYCPSPGSLIPHKRDHGCVNSTLGTLAVDVGRNATIAGAVASYAY